MKVVETVKVKDSIDVGSYLNLVEAIVNFAFITGENGELQYAPHYMTAALPAIITHFCLDGIEFEEDEDSIYSIKLVTAIKENEEVSELINDILYGISDKYSYIYSALEDANKLIEYRLEQLKPFNVFMNGMNNMLEEIKKELSPEDIAKFVKGVNAYADVQTDES